MPPQAASQPSPMAMLFPFVFMFAIFYLLVFRPQAKARKAHDLMLKNLKKHDEVITTGGIFGAVMNVRPESITLRVDEHVRLEVERAAIVRIVKPSAGVTTESTS